MYKIIENIGIGSIITLKSDIDTKSLAKKELENIISTLPACFNKISYREKLSIKQYK